MFLYMDQFAASYRLREILLPPANEVCEGYVFTGVCLSTGGYLPHCMLGYTPHWVGHPPGQTPPADTCLGSGAVCPIACWDTHPPGQTLPLGKHPPCAVHAGIRSTSGQ